MDDEEKKESQGFLKQGKDKVNDVRDKAKKAKRLFKAFMKLPTPVKIAILVIILVLIVVILFAAFLYAHRMNTHDTAIQSMEIITQGVDVNASGESSGEGLSQDSVGISNIVTMDDGAWVIKIPDESKEYLQSYAEANNMDIDVSSMTEEQILIELLKANGLKDTNFTDEELKVLPYLLKAEIATQYMDLRPESEMYTDGKYNVPDINLEDTKIPGTVHIKRVNSKDKSKINLSYLDYEEFKKLTDNVEEAKKYFSFNYDGNLVVYTWNHTKVYYTYTSGTPDSYKSEDTDDYYLSETIIDYKHLITSYSLPYNVLVALLVTTRDPSFAEDVANLAFDSNIEIGLMEEYQFNRTINTTKYYQTIRGYQVIDGIVTVNGLKAYERNNTLVKVEKSTTETVECNHEGNIHGAWYTYQYTIPTSGEPAFTITQTTDIETNDYKFGILNADTWFVKTEKEYDNQKETDDPVTTKGEKIEGSFVLNSEKVETGENARNNLKSQDAKDRMNKDINDAKTKLTPSVSTSGDTGTIKTKIAMSNLYYKKKIVNEETSEVSYANAGISCYGHTSETVSDFASWLSVSYQGGASYSFGGAFTTDWSKLKLNISEYLKTDYQTTTKTSKTRYNFVEGTTKNKLYDKKDEKFLLVIDINPKAQAALENIPSWFYQMVEKYDTNYKTLLEYLIDKYFGRVSESSFDIDSFLSEGIGEFTSLLFNTGTETGWWWPIGPDENGKPITTSIVGSYDGYRSYKGTIHGAIDIGAGKGTPVIATRGGTVVKVVDGFSDGKYDTSYMNKANYILIKHPDGMYSGYWHLLKGTITVTEGMTVYQGQKIAESGNSGFTQGPHLHFEIRDKDNKKVNPLNYVSTNNPYPEQIMANTGNTPEEKVWIGLKQAGFKDESIAAVMGNIYAESEFKSDVVNNIGASGLCQWLGGRRDGLKRYAESKSKNWTDVDIQVQYLRAEINKTGPAADFATLQMSGTYHGYTKADWENPTNIDEATKAFCRIFERCSEKEYQGSINKRINAAKDYYSQFHGKQFMASQQYNGDFLQVAEQCHEFLHLNNFYYSGSTNISSRKYVSDSISVGGCKIPITMDNYYHGVDCSSYVCWVLYEYGYSDFGGTQKTTSWFVSNINTLKTKYGWTIKNGTEASPGDIVVYNNGSSGHMEIYAGNGNMYSAGSTTKGIRVHHTSYGSGINERLKKFTYAITVTKRGGS